MTIHDVLTTIEAAKLWGFEESTIKKACQSGKFKIGDEARKEDTGPRGRWLVTRAGMERLYGEIKTLG